MRSTEGRDCLSATNDGTYPLLQPAEEKTESDDHPSVVSDPKDGPAGD